MLAGAAFSGSALGAIVCASPNLPLPQNLDGFYINLVTGATGTSGSLTPGWDFNPYASNGATLLSYENEPTPPDPRIAILPLRPALWRPLGIAHRSGSIEAAVQHVLEALRMLRQG